MLDRLREKEAGRDVRQGWADPVSAASLVDIKSRQREQKGDFKHRSERTNGLRKGSEWCKNQNLACVCSFSITLKLMLTIPISQTLTNFRQT